MAQSASSVVQMLQARLSTLKVAVCPTSNEHAVQSMCNAEIFASFERINRRGN